MRKLFNTLPEMNKRLLIRCLQFFSLVGENDVNETSLSYLAYLLGPLFFYDQTDAEEEDGDEPQIYYNKDLVYDLMMQLFQYHQEICPTPLEELPHWKKSRDMDSISRLKKGKDRDRVGSPSPAGNVVLPSYEPPTDDELQQETKAEQEVIPPSSPNAAAVKRKKGVIGTLKLSKLKQQYLGELPDTPPPGTTPANYVMPANYGQI